MSHNVADYKLFTHRDIFHFTGFDSFFLHSQQPRKITSEFFKDHSRQEFQCLAFRIRQNSTGTSSFHSSVAGFLHSVSLETFVRLYRLHAVKFQKSSVDSLTKL